MRDVPDARGPAVVVSSVGTAPTPVAPPPISPIRNVERDAGVSAPLSDGSVAWFFGDTGERLTDGSLRYFVVGTAAWAPPSAPTAPVDWLSGITPVPFAPVLAPEFRCSGRGEVAGRWPLSAVVDKRPKSGRDKVLLWMGNVCLGSSVTPYGISFGEWEYDPASPPPGRPLSVKVVNPLLATSRPIGDSSLVGADGRLYLFGCDGAPPMRSRPCFVARTTLTRAGDTSSYRWWNGSTWGSERSARPMVLNDGPEGPNSPQGPFSVVWDQRLGFYLMMYSPWPGFVPLGVVRAAKSPQGPWGPLAQFALPGCEDGLTDATRACYGVNAQPQYSTADRTGIGYSDRLGAEGPERGAFLLTTIKVDAAPR